ncbi:MAG TPA: hypothetical protein VJR04_16800 [Terriglobales bacterium]|nr:hypothetical protein [Terriglobales bacterium]
MTTKMEHLLAVQEGREEILDLIQELDGNGLIITDDELIREALGLQTRSG